MKMCERDIATQSHLMQSNYGKSAGILMIPPLQASQKPGEYNMHVARGGHIFRKYLYTGFLCECVKMKTNAVWKMNTVANL